MTDSMAVCSVDHDVSVLVGHTHWLELRQWNMLPDRSTTRYTVGIFGSKVYCVCWQAPPSLTTMPPMPPIGGPDPPDEPPLPRAEVPAVPGPGVLPVPPPLPPVPVAVGFTPAVHPSAAISMAPVNKSGADRAVPPRV